MTLEYLHHLILVPAFMIAAIYHAHTAPRFHTSRLRAVVYTVLLTAIGYIGVYAAGDFYNVFLRARGQWPNARMNIFGAIYFVLIGTFLMILLEKHVRLMLKNRFHKNVALVSLRDTWDLIQPGSFVLLAAIKCRCAWAGCCYGFYCDWGIYSHYAKGKVFPVQLVEAIMIICVAVVCYFIKRTRFFRRGMAFYISAAMYAFGRFFLEYVMYYEPEGRTYLGVFTFWQCAAMLLFAASVAILIYLYKTQPSEPLPKKWEPAPEPEQPPKPPKKKKTIPRAEPKKRHGGEWQSTKKKYKKKKK